MLLEACIYQTNAPRRRKHAAAVRMHSRTLLEQHADGGGVLQMSHALPSVPAAGAAGIPHFGGAAPQGR